MSKTTPKSAPVKGRMEPAAVAERTSTAARTDVAPDQLAPSVSPRTSVIVDETWVRLTNDAAIKRNMFTSRPGEPAGMTNMQTWLHVEAWVRNTTYAKHVWIDMHVFENDAGLVHSETLPLEYARPAGDGGDLFILDAMVFQGYVATQGSVDLRPDVRVVQFRLYCELDGQVFTDGILHECLLEDDALTT
jgi:hypothetical protein